MILNSLIDPKGQIELESPGIPQEIKPRAIPWNVKRQMLEAKDRAEAESRRADEKILKEKEDQLKKLEEETLVNAG